MYVGLNMYHGGLGELPDSGPNDCVGYSNCMTQQRCHWYHAVIKEYISNGLDTPVSSHWKKLDTLVSWIVVYWMLNFIKSDTSGRTW